jgi:UDP-MurNAc hydroxylase
MNRATQRVSTPLQIQFLNHASVKIITGTVSIVSDPWLWGSIFNNGLELISPSESLFPIAADSDFIWLSHEHPDHFSPAFFKRLNGNKPRVLFQATRDRRVVRYLDSQGFTVSEIENCEFVHVTPTEQFMIGRNGLYDSWSLLESAGKTILNINDCILKTRGDLEAITKRVGHVDVLLTQFSYAGWAGDRRNKALHEDAAKRRLDVVRTQLECLAPDYVIPFASFAWYCHDENAYLNASVNRIPDFLEVCAATKSIPIVMKPLDRWCVGEAHDNASAIQFWESAYDAIPSRSLRVSSRASTIADVQSRCEAFRQRVFAKNSKTWMRVLSFVPLLNLFRPIHIRLADLQKTVRFSFFDGLREVSDAQSPDIEMSCESLLFMFDNEFGFDTLMVNARCNASRSGLDAVMKNFAVGNLNAMGWSVGWGMFGTLAREFRLVWLVLRELNNVNPG